MNFKVIKYFLLSRFAKGFLLGLLLFLLLMVSVYTISLPLMAFNPKFLLRDFRESFIITLSLFIITSPLTSTVQKADFDFLIPAPLSKSEIALLYVIASILLGGSYFAVLGLLFILVYQFPVNVLSFIAFSLFGFSISSLSIIRERFIVMVLAFVWIWLPYLGVNFSPTSLIFNAPVNGIISSLLFSAFVFFRVFTSPQLSFSESKGKETKSIVNYHGEKNFLIKYFLLTYEFAWGYGSTLSGRKLLYYVLSYPKVLATVSVIALAYFVIFRILNPTFYAYVVVSVSVLSFLVSFGIYSLSQERPWVVFTSLDRGKYLAIRIIIKTLQNALLSFPFSVVDIILGKVTLGINIFFGTLIGYLLTAYLTSKLNPIQFKVDYYNYRARSGLLVIILTNYFIMGVTILSSLTVLSSIAFVIASVMLTITLARKSVWEEISYEIIENGFT